MRAEGEEDGEVPEEGGGKEEDKRGEDEGRDGWRKTQRKWVIYL